MDIFELTKLFPKDEKYSMTDQIRRSSRSVCANLAEAWSKRMYIAALKQRLVDAVAEAAETQTWLEYSFKCNYMSGDVSRGLYTRYREIIRLLASMHSHPEKWILPKK